MGGNAHLMAVVDDAAHGEYVLSAACARLRQLQDRWSRFRSDSEVSRLGRADGRPLQVSGDTRLLVAWCVRAWRRSAGRFDASVLDALERHGYDRTFELLAHRPTGREEPVQSLAAPGCAGIAIDEEAGTVALPTGLRLDPGGIGKGLAADLVTAAMLSAGAFGSCVNLSGDVRARGLGPGGTSPGWTVGVEHPDRPGEAVALIRLPERGGAVASSSVRIRRWAAAHHIIDPADGCPSSSDVVAVTVVADDGAWADAATKIALVCGRHQEAIGAMDEIGVAALLILDDHRILPTARLAADPGLWSLPDQRPAVITPS
jgi:thiamine biosynthesis lipoprotein